MKIALLNSWLMNGGDAGIIYGTHDAIQRVLPDAEITVFGHLVSQAACYYPDLCLEQMPQDTWPENKYLNALMRKSFAARDNFGLSTQNEKNFYKKLARMDIIVYCGGGYINDLYSTGNLFSVIQRTLELGKPHMAYAHSFGPFFKKKNLSAAVQLLNSFQAVTARDENSYNLLGSAKLKCKIFKFTADAAFSMDILNDCGLLKEGEKGALNSIFEFKLQRGNAPLLIISVRKWLFPGFKNTSALQQKYKNEIRRFVEYVIEKSGWRVCFMSTCQGRQGYGYDDALFAEELIEGLPKRFKRDIYICRCPFSPRAYPLIIAQAADLVLSMRMHFAIYSIMAGMPFVAIAYEKKTSELAKQIGLEQFCHDLETICSKELINSFLNVNAQKNALQQKIKLSYQQLRERSMNNATILAGLIEDKGKIS